MMAIRGEVVGIEALQSRGGIRVPRIGDGNDSERSRPLLNLPVCCGPEIASKPAPCNTVACLTSDCFHLLKGLRSRRRAGEQIKASTAHESSRAARAFFGSQSDSTQTTGAEMVDTFGRILVKT